jgi:multiple sugar transport system permease protein
MIRVRATVTKIGLYALVAILCFLFLVPFLWQLSTSLKPTHEVLLIPIKWIPSRVVLDNYVEAWEYARFGRYVKNTVVVTVLNVIGHLLVGAFVGFGFARMRFPGRDVLFIVVLSTMMIPFHVKAVPMYLIFRNLGWLDTLKPLFVPAFFGADPLTLFLFRQFFRTIPDELDEAAEIDGCSPIQIWSRIVLPLSGPVVATVSIFSFMWSWNNLWEPLIYLTNRDKFTISVGLRFLLGEFGLDYHLLMAASVIAVIPCLIVFFAFQKFFVSGVATTGLKG